MGDAMHMCCPFCGGDRILLTETRAQVSSRVEYSVRCGSCAAEGPWFQSPVAATRAWDRRTEPARKTATIIHDFGQGGT